MLLKLLRAAVLLNHAVNMTHPDIAEAHSLPRDEQVHARALKYGRNYDNTYNPAYDQQQVRAYHEKQEWSDCSKDYCCPNGYQCYLWDGGYHNGWHNKMYQCTTQEGCKEARKKSYNWQCDKYVSCGSKKWDRADYQRQDVSGRDARADYQRQDVSGRDARADFQRQDMSGRDARADFQRQDMGQDQGAAAVRASNHQMKQWSDCSKDFCGCPNGYKCYMFDGGWHNGWHNKMYQCTSQEGCKEAKKVNTNWQCDQPAPCGYDSGHRHDTAASAKLVAASADAAPAEDVKSLEKDFQAGQMQRASFDADKFTLKFESKTPGKGGEVIAQTVVQAPILGVMPANGVSQAMVTLEACAINQPHVHPRATETAHVLQGEVLFGLQEENGAAPRFLQKNVTQGQSFLLVQGLVHFVQNLGCEQVKFLATFDHRDPGTITLLSSFFAFDNPTIRATLQLQDADFAAVQAAAKAATNPSQDPVCLQRCGLAAGGNGGGGAGGGPGANEGYNQASNQG